VSKDAYVKSFLIRNCLNVDLEWLLLLQGTLSSATVV